MINNQFYGSRKFDKVFIGFNTLSEDSFEYLKNNSLEEITIDKPKQENLLHRFVYLAESTSNSIRLLLSHNQLLPSLALLRIRLEQVIVFSYLINEQSEKGISKFIEFLPIKNYQIIKSVKNNKFLTPESERNKHPLIDEFERGDSEFTYSRNWTNLSLLSMASRVDELVKDDKNYGGFKFEVDYAVFYKIYSSLIHCDMLAITDFVSSKIEQVNNIQKTTIIPNDFDYKQALALISHFDITQVYEFLKYQNIDGSDFINEKNRIWHQFHKRLIYSGK